MAKEINFICQILCLLLMCMNKVLYLHLMIMTDCKVRLADMLLLYRQGMTRLKVSDSHLTYLLVIAEVLNLLLHLIEKCIVKFITKYQVVT
jgi:hypothetical protein